MYIYFLNIFYNIYIYIFLKYIFVFQHFSDDLTGRPYRLPIDRSQIRHVDQIDNPQNGHEYLYLARYSFMVSCS